MGRTRSVGRRPTPGPARSHARALAAIAALLLAVPAGAAPPVPPPAAPSPIPAARRTAWRPGIPGGVPARTRVCATLAAAAFGDGTADATPAIQAAVDACPLDGVVSLGPGDFRLSGPITLQKPVVLRGAGAGRTTLRMAAGSVAVMIGSWTHFGTPAALRKDAPLGTSTLELADAAAFAPGDLVHLDQLDDPAVVQGKECPYLKRGGPGAWRSIGQVVEVAAKAGHVLTLSSPLHWTFRTALRAEVVPLSPRPTRGAGLEDLRIAGATNVAVNVQYAAYSWIKGVETDTVDGVHVALAGTYRFVLRDSYAHHSAKYWYGGGSYGYSLEWQASDNLVENNVVHAMNKPILFRASGGGNVVAYNAVDDAWAVPGFQEVGIDSHCSFPHMELVEGNYAPHAGVMSTWGNAGHLTWFRNHFSTTSRGRPGDWQNVAAIQLDARMVGMNVVGNVLGVPERKGARYETTTAATCGIEAPFVFRLNADSAGGYCSFPAPADRRTSDELLRHGNFDYATGQVTWDPAIVERALPRSLYLDARPAFFGELPWPWVEPAGEVKLHVLPARRRLEEAAAQRPAGEGGTSPGRPRDPGPSGAAPGRARGT